jgi:Ribbon-helix-helix protein, copG family
VAERAERVTVRLSPMLVQRLDALAAARGMSRSACLRALVAEGALSPADAIPGEAELLQVTAERARSGNMAAIRLLLDRRDGDASEFERLLGVTLSEEGA